MSGRLSEAQIQAGVKSAGRAGGWFVSEAPADSREVGAGWADLYLSRGRIMLAVEMKADRGRLTAEQKKALKTYHSRPRGDEPRDMWWYGLACCGQPAAAAFADRLLCRHAEFVDWIEAQEQSAGFVLLDTQTRLSVDVELPVGRRPYDRAIAGLRRVNTVTAAALVEHFDMEQITDTVTRCCPYQDPSLPVHVWCQAAASTVLHVLNERRGFRQGQTFTHPDHHGLLLRAL